MNEQNRTRCPECGGKGWHATKNGGYDCGTCHWATRSSDGLAKASKDALTVEDVHRSLVEADTAPIPTFREVYGPPSTADEKTNAMREVTVWKRCVFGASVVYEAVGTRNCACCEHCSGTHMVDDDCRMCESCEREYRRDAARSEWPDCFKVTRAEYEVLMRRWL